MTDETEVESPIDTQLNALSRLLATETGVFVLIFFGILGILTILTILGQESLVLIVGAGSILGFLVIMLLAISDQVYDLLCDKQRGTILGLIILGVFIVLVWYLFPPESNRMFLLTIIVSVIFLLWTLAQAYFMSIPISTTSAQIAANFEEPKHNAFTYLVLAASVGLPGLFYPYLALKVLPLLGVKSLGLEDYLWVAGMIALVGILWILIIRFLRPIMDKQDAIIFSGVFFGAYMLFIFYRSLFFLAKLHDVIGATSNPSLIGNILDILFMIMTILLAVFSFSKRAFQTNLPVLTENNSIFIAFAFGTGYASAQLFYVAGAEDATAMMTWISMVSHLLIFVCALVIILFVPYSYVISKGYTVPTQFREAFSLRQQETSDVTRVVDEEMPKEVVIEEEPAAEEVSEVTTDESPSVDLADEETVNETEDSTEDEFKEEE